MLTIHYEPTYFLDALVILENIFNTMSNGLGSAMCVKYNIYCGVGRGVEGRRV